ncbi:MAG: YfiR family protein [Methylococcales bacterium]|nr:YfiR family protein [Methylococcales bacterium]
MKVFSWLWILWCLLFSQLLFADEASVEYKIKAGYLYNFTKFVTWPEINSETFNLCILGEDPFGELIDPIEKRTAFGRSIKLLRFDSLDALKRTNNKPHCHIIFLSASMGSVTKEITGKNTLIIRDIDKTLTVGEGDNFAMQGGMIGFINKEGKIKLQINLKKIKQSELKVSAKLLEVSEVIEGGNSD